MKAYIGLTCHCRGIGDAYQEKGLPKARHGQVNRTEGQQQQLRRRENGLIETFATSDLCFMG